MGIDKKATSEIADHDISTSQPGSIASCRDIQERILVHPTSVYLPVRLARVDTGEYDSVPGGPTSASRYLVSGDPNPILLVVYNKTIGDPYLPCEQGPIRLFRTVEIDSYESDLIPS
ncbi:hypothetical protein F5X96DRAFT_672131 [Biscogniauxia mediterranea]|nr:hypothetical protein F5X96DRAFT_672131 [Biscogniauxia mediterranea]